MTIAAATTMSILPTLSPPRCRTRCRRVSGVGNVQVFGSQYAMRIWMDPYKLHDYGLMPSDMSNAIKAQNTQVSAGSLGAQPAVPGQELNATVTAQSQMQTAGAVPRHHPQDPIRRAPWCGCAMSRASNWARIPTPSRACSTAGRPRAPRSCWRRAPMRLATVDAVKARAEALRASLPPGMKMSYPIDNTDFIRLSIRQVVETLIVAIILVVLVMYVFLQNWRTTLVPAMAVPVVLLGTFGILAATGYSINTLTLFALVLVIGLLVDDAIVVVENVERIMREERLPPRDATLRSMTEITGALIGIGLVLTAVFLPMAFFGGSTGVIYRQFSVTIVSAMLLSIMCALVLTPALCATLLKPYSEEHARSGLLGRFFGWFNRNFERMRDWLPQWPAPHAESSRAS